jgi:hypothetical protein
MNIQEYSIAAITTLGSINPSTIAKEIGVHQTTTSRFLQKTDFKEINIEQTANRLFGKKNLVVVIDEFVASRRYAENTEGTSSMIDPATKTFTNGYKVVTSGLTDGKLFIPFDFGQWIAKFILGDVYKKITDIAKNLILKILNSSLNIKHFVMDGLYFAKEFMDWLCEQNVNFVIKAKTTTSVLYKGEKTQLQHCKSLKLNSNQTAKTIMAEWNGKLWYFTAVQRSGKHGPKIIYLISNFKTKSKKYKKLYNSRWVIEKCFRTTKQYLGLKGSSSQFAHTYLAHIKCVFFAYTLLQFCMKKFKLRSAEEAIRKIQAWKNRHGFQETVNQVKLLENHA